ncbi:MAG: hypothetical protein CTY34_10530 [Methylobacter sp.]|nr:MAG: hypothetical protein CTY34_10530 [Methylobacter sp.]
MPGFRPLSKYPSVHRDLALTVAENLAAETLLECIKTELSEVLQTAVIFDVYRGKGIEAGFKSIALSLELQDFSQTLTDAAIDAIFSKLLATLANTIGAKLRE